MGGGNTGDLFPQKKKKGGGNTGDSFPQNERKVTKFHSQIIPKLMLFRLRLKTTYHYIGALGLLPYLEPKTPISLQNSLFYIYISIFTEPYLLQFLGDLSVIL